MASCSLALYSTATATPTQLHNSMRLEATSGCMAPSMATQLPSNHQSKRYSHIMQGSTYAVPDYVTTLGLQIYNLTRNHLTHAGSRHPLAARPKQAAHCNNGKRICCKGHMVVTLLLGSASLGSSADRAACCCCCCCFAAGTNALAADDRLLMPSGCASGGKGIPSGCASGCRYT